MVKREALLWPAVREGEGKLEYKHARVHGGQRQRDDCTHCTLVLVGNVRKCGECTRAAVTNGNGGDCTRFPYGNDRTGDLVAPNGKRDYNLLPDREPLSLFFHDETTTKENDDGNCLWQAGVKSAQIKKKREGRAAHAPGVVGVDRGSLVLGAEYWGTIKEDQAVEQAELVMRLQGLATEGRDLQICLGHRQYYGRSGEYVGRQEGEGEAVCVWKKVQDAVTLFTGIDCSLQGNVNEE